MSFKSLSKLGQKGFTLIEVLISVVLLVVISLAIYQATTDSFKLREILSSDADFYSAIRLSMSVLDRDISMLFTPKIALPPSTLRKLDPNAAPATPVPGTPPTPPTSPSSPDAMDAQDQQAIVFGDREKGTVFWSSVLDKTGIRMSRFIGTDTSMSFVSVSNLRVYKDSRESVFLKIFFELSDEKNPEPEYQNTKTLVKRTNSNAFAIEQDDDTFTKRYPLLRGVKSLKFSYYNREKDNWLSAWDSDGADNKGSYPDLIKVEIKVVGPQNLQFEGLYKFRPEIPVNGINPST